jgi:glycosyltransferase involved in cell wall biosynthesis
MKQNILAVVLSSYNGEKYIKEQLVSLQNQSYTSFDLFIRDDASRDNTLKIIEEFKDSSSLHVNLLKADKNIGALRSFEVLLKMVLEYPQYETIMLCDQDDIWLEDKIKLSLDAFINFENSVKKDIPLLLYTDLFVVDENLTTLSSSFWKYFNLNPSNNSLNSLIVQCNVTGCTMIFNKTLASLALPFSDATVMHDHWLGLVATSMGEISYIDKSTIKYRQHSTNVSGGADHFGVSYILKKALKYFNSDEFYQVLGRQIEQAKAFLDLYGTKLSHKDYELLSAFISLEKLSLASRIKTVMKYKLYKHGLIRNIGLFMWLLKMGVISK